MLWYIYTLKYYRQSNERDGKIAIFNNTDELKIIILIKKKTDTNIAHAV